MRFKAKRLGAYVVDMMLCGLLGGLISSFFINDANVESLNNSLSKMLSAAGNNISMIQLKSICDVLYDISYQNLPYVIVMFIIILFYFGVFQYINNGATLGKKMFGIRVVGVDSKMDINSFIYRSFIIDDLFSYMASIIFTLFTSGIYYVLFYGVCSLFMSAILIICCFMIIYREDGRGLHDLLLKSKVIEVK